MRGKIGNNQQAVLTWLQSQNDRDEFFNEQQIITGTGLQAQKTCRAIDSLVSRGLVEFSIDGWLTVYRGVNDDN